MAVDRTLWNEQIRTWPVWPCPHCGSIALSVNEESLVTAQTGMSKEAMSHEGWEISWIDERFTAQLVCGNSSCGNVVVVCGKVQCDEHLYYDHEGKTQGEIVRTYVPSYFLDTLSVFPIAQECPGAVADELTKSFGLLWCDTSSAANRVRTGVEALLTDQGIPRTTINKKNKREHLSLHNRIAAFKKKKSDAADTLLAIKWLGNEGSHAGTEALSVEDLLDAYALFEHAIELVYVKRQKKMSKLASDIIKKRGSVRRKKKKGSIL